MLSEIKMFLFIFAEIALDHLDKQDRRALLPFAHDIASWSVINKNILRTSIFKYNNNNKEYILLIIRLHFYD